MMAAEDDIKRIADDLSVTKGHISLMQNWLRLLVPAVFVIAGLAGFAAITLPSRIASLETNLSSKIGEVDKSVAKLAQAVTTVEQSSGSLQASVSQLREIEKNLGTLRAQLDGVVTRAERSVLDERLRRLESQVDAIYAHLLGKK